MEHSDLVAEMVHVERLTTQERLHLARHRRLQQLKVWRQREKEWLRHQTRHTSTKRHIFFNDSVMLLEAAARNDIDEGREMFHLSVCSIVYSDFQACQEAKIACESVVTHTYPLNPYLSAYVYSEGVVVNASFYRPNKIIFLLLL